MDIKQKLKIQDRIQSKKKKKNKKQLHFSSTNSLIILKCDLSMLKWIS